MCARLLLSFRPLLVTVVLAGCFMTTVTRVPTPASAAATTNCAGVTDWYIDLPATNDYYFVKTGGGWVSSFHGDGSDPFGTISLSTGGGSFHAFNRYLESYAHDYTATFDGKLASNCTIGQSTPPGKWSSNHGSVGIFLASPFDQPAGKYDIAGTVTGPDGEPVAGIVIDVRTASGAVVASATTGGDGHYQTIELDPATYLVEPATDSEDFSPSVLRVNLVSASVTVNFEEGCGSGSPTPGVTRAARLKSDTAAAAPACPLKVFVRALEPLRSGLAVHSQPYNEFPVDFVAAVSGPPALLPGSSEGGNVFRCESGCTDLEVTVINPKTQKAVPKALVTASVGEIWPRYDGNEWLCTTLDNGRTSSCSTTSASEKTDSDGHAFLRYWAPGEVSTASTTLDVSAKVACSQIVCRKKELYGSARPLALNVKPYLIYADDVMIPEEQAKELAAWAGGSSPFGRFISTTSFGAKIMAQALKWQEANEKEAETAAEALKAVEKVERVLFVVEAARAFSDLWERHALTDLFLEDTDLSPLGLGDTPTEAFVSGAPSNLFSYNLVNFNVALPGQVGADGAWWKIAMILSAAQFGDEKYDNLADFGIDLKVYEVSHCEATKDDCDPGYRNDPGSSIVLRGGIQPELAFQITLVYKGGVRLGDYYFEVPYDAIAWTQKAQHDLKDVIAG